MANVTRHRGRWTLDHRLESAYHYLPVDVPPGAGGLRVELDYDDNAAIIDLGCLGPAGFRGWSGGARRSYVITPDAATPGYLPGELEPGTWHVMLGLYRLPAEGAGYEVAAYVTSAVDAAAATVGIAVGRDAPPPPQHRPARRELPATGDRRWLAGDLHAHTVHSDGALTVSELAGYAVERGLDYLAITDHNTISHHAELPAASARYGITLVPGQEVTTSEGHANAFGDIGWIDFRRPADAWLAETERRGGLLSVNHPLAGDSSWIHRMRRRPPLAEVWHWTWLDPRWTAMLAWWFAWDPAAVPVGGSDWHRAGSDAPVGAPTTWVECDGTDVLGGLAAGRVAISAGRDGPVLLRRCGELTAIDADGLLLVGPDGPRVRVSGTSARFDDRPGCHRLVDPTGATLALTP